MNKWECSALGCDSFAVGFGGALGLRAVGWFFEVGKPLLCPLHRPDPTMERASDGVSSLCPAAGPCTLCAADREAARLQYAIAEKLGLVDDYFRQQMEYWSKKEVKES